jgi:uncharacterized protein YrrD
MPLVMRNFQVGAGLMVACGVFPDVNAGSTTNRRWRRTSRRFAIVVTSPLPAVNPYGPAADSTNAANQRTYRGLAVLNTIGQLLETRVIADDGAQGQVLDAYFDEDTWQIRYLLIEVSDPFRASHVFYPADATRDFDQGGRLRVDCLERRLPVSEEVRSLRSSRQVMGCDVAAWTGALGTTGDAVIETDSWLLLFLVVDAGNWCPGGVVLIQPQLVESAQWEERTIDVAVAHVEVLTSPFREDSVVGVGDGSGEFLH